MSWETSVLKGKNKKKNSFHQNKINLLLFLSFLSFFRTNRNKARKKKTTPKNKKSTTPPHQAKKQRRRATTLLKKKQEKEMSHNGTEEAHKLNLKFETITTGSDNYSVEPGLKNVKIASWRGEKKIGRTCLVFLFVCLFLSFQHALFPNNGWRWWFFLLFSLSLSCTLGVFFFFFWWSSGAMPLSTPIFTSSTYHLASAAHGTNAKIFSFGTNQRNESLAI